MVESRGVHGVDRLNQGVSARSWRASAHSLRPTWGWLAEPIGLVGGGGAAFVPRGCTGLACMGQLTHFSGWLTGPGDGSMGPSLRVMNSMCVYIYIIVAMGGVTSSTPVAGVVPI
jgi:hypothetical protein